MSTNQKTRKKDQTSKPVKAKKPEQQPKQSVRLAQMLDAPETLRQNDIMDAQGQLGNQVVQRALDKDRQRKSLTDNQGNLDEKISGQIQSKRGGGTPLPENLQKDAGKRFKRDFSDVRLHMDDQADQLSRTINARAFTIGKDIFFKKGVFAPGTSAGRETLIHELTHVVQQSGSKSAGGRLKLGGRDTAQEKEADRIGKQNSQPKSVTASAGAVQTYGEEEEDLQMQGDEDEELLQGQEDEEEEELMMQEDDDEELLQEQEDEDEEELMMQEDEDEELLQGQEDEEEEELMMQEDEDEELLQGQEDEEEELMMQEDEEEELQMQPDVAGVVQRKKKKVTGIGDEEFKKRQGVFGTSVRRPRRGSVPNVPVGLKTSKRRSLELPKVPVDPKLSKRRMSLPPTLKKEDDGIPDPPPMPKNLIPKLPKVQGNTMEDIKTFDKTQLKKTETRDKAQERRSFLSSVKKFDQTGLKKTETRDKGRERRDLLSSIKKFDQSGLKKTETKDQSTETMNKAYLAESGKPTPLKKTLQREQLVRTIKDPSSSTEDVQKAESQLRSLHKGKWYQKNVASGALKERQKSLKAQAEIGTEGAFEKWQAEKKPSKLSKFGKGLWGAAKGLIGSGVKDLKEHFFGPEKKAPKPKAPKPSPVTVNVSGGGSGSGAGMAMISQLFEENKQLKAQLAELKKEEQD